jgi:N-acetylglucosamine kinase-like BadF-type ATPase
MKGVDVGVDIGGTKTHLRAQDENGEKRDLVVPTAEWRVRDWQRDAEAVLALARQLAGGTGIGAIAVGAHGCDDASECDAFQAAFAERVAFPVRVVNDAELLPAALGYENQIGLVAGTGSIAVCRDGTLGMMVAGGWGWVIGDEGSAAGLIREAARTVTLHLDGGGEPSEPLVEMLLAALAIKNAARIGSAIAELGSSAALGRHAPLVFEAEERGSPLAREVIRDGARHLVGLVEQLKKRGARATRVVAGGGVIAGQPSLADKFLQEFASRFDGSMMAEIYAGPPVEGACRLAAALTGGAVRQDVDGRRTASSA